MLTKRAIIVALAGLNLLLLAMIVLGSYSLPAAYAQGRGSAGDFTAVTALAPGQTYEVLYLLDTRNRRLHAFYPQNVTTRKLSYVGFQDLPEDFRTK